MILRDDVSRANMACGWRARPRVYIVSDVRLLREGLVATLAQETRIEVAGASCIEDAVSIIQAVCPNLLLIDLASPGALHLPARLRPVMPDLLSIAFAVTEGETDVLACAEWGLSGYVAQDGSAEDLVAAVLRAVDGELICSPQIAALLFERVAALAARTTPASSEPLTPRECEIAELVARGLPNKAIARELALAPATIKNHVHNILQKLSVHRRAEVALTWHKLRGLYPAVPSRAVKDGRF